MENILDKIDSIFEVTKYSKKYHSEINIKNATHWLEDMISDEFILKNLPKDIMLSMYEKFLEEFEKRCDYIISKSTNQRKFSIGSKVKIKYDFDSIKKDDIGIIENVIRVEEDTFGQGWYCYTINGQIMYENEFEIL